MKTNLYAFGAVLMGAALVTSAAGEPTISSKPWVASATRTNLGPVDNGTLAVSQTSKPWVNSTPGAPTFEIAFAGAPPESAGTEQGSKPWLNPKPYKTLAEVKALPAERSVSVVCPHCKTAEVARSGAGLNSKLRETKNGVVLTCSKCGGEAFCCPTSK